MFQIIFLVTRAFHNGLRPPQRPAPRTPRSPSSGQRGRRATMSIMKLPATDFSGGDMQPRLSKEDAGLPPGERASAPDAPRLRTEPRGLELVRKLDPVAQQWARLARIDDLFDAERFRHAER